MLLPALIFVCAFLQPVTDPAPVTTATSPAPGLFHDEMDKTSLWSLSDAPHDPFVSADAPGVLTLIMPQVAQGFTQSYQWGEVSRTVVINTDALPVLVARVSRLSDGGYAHIIVEIRDSAGEIIKSSTSTALHGAGYTTVNLQNEFGTGLLRLKIRLIVGGANSGAWCDYDYLRAMTINDFTALQNAPVATAPKRRRKQ